MSARPEWMPSEAALTSIEYHAEEALRLGSHRNTHDAMRAFAYRTGLRARLDALESLIEGQTGHMVDRAKKMIEEIGKELEG